MDLIMALLAEYIGQASRQGKAWQDILRAAVEFRKGCDRKLLRPCSGVWAIFDITHQLCTFLYSKGYAPIGNGCFGVVLPYPGDATKVLKVVLADQDGFDLFAEDVILAQRCYRAYEFMPKIYWRAECKGVRMYCMEYLPRPWEDCSGCPEELRDYVEEELCPKYPGTIPDLHGGNYMRRADGTAVLIDPIASGGKANTLNTLAVKLIQGVA